MGRIGRMQMRTSFTRGGQWAGGLRPHRLRCTRIKVGFGPAGGMGGGAPNQQKPDLEWVSNLSEL